MKAINLDKDAMELSLHIARLIRYLSSITNGPLIFFFRPTYQFAFKYFIRTNPKYWNKVEKSFDNYRKNSGNHRKIFSTAFSVNAASVNNSAPLCSYHESEKSTDVIQLNKKETSWARKSADISKTGSGNCISNDLPPHQNGQEFRKISDDENKCIPL